MRKTSLLKLSLKSYKSTSERLILEIFSKPVINLLIGSLLGSIFIFLSHFLLQGSAQSGKKQVAQKLSPPPPRFFLSLKSRSLGRRGGRGERKGKVSRGNIPPLMWYFSAKQIRRLGKINKLVLVIIKSTLILWRKKFHKKVKVTMNLIRLIVLIIGNTLIDSLVPISKYQEKDTS